MSRNRPYLILGIGLLMAGALLLAAVSHGQTEDAEKILLNADQIRNPSESFSMEVELSDPHDPATRMVYEVSIQGNSKTLIKTLEPPREVGKDLLMLGEDMWVVFPNLKRPVRVTLGQRLTGEAANGDIARMRWSGDYIPKVESQTPTDWILFLTAKKPGLTYDKLRVVISKKNYSPVRADFLTQAGQILKSAQYGAYKFFAGKLRPSETLIQNATEKNRSTLIRLRKMRVQSFAASVFDKNNLK